VITSGPSFRSRRRQSSFGLFGRPLHQVKIGDVTDRVWPPQGVADARSREQGHDDGHSLDQQQASLRDVVARVQREARLDQRLRGLTAGAELDALIDETVCALWASSRVKTFVPLLAMRRIYESLGLPDEPLTAADERSDRYA
jgi:hypothetical protein